jgi:DNA-binding GntR family transcriptional regulator
MQDKSEKNSAESIESLPLRDIVFRKLRQEILRGELEPGDRLMEMQLSEQLGVSRTPVREAIRKLELEGLVRMVPRKGAEVAGLSEKSVKDVLEVRRVLEELVAKLACNRIQDELLEYLERQIQDFTVLTASTNKKDYAAITQMDVECHETSYQATGNDRLIQIISQMRDQMYRFRMEYIKANDMRRILVDEHQRLLHALRERNEEEAVEAIREHISNQEITIAFTLIKSRQRTAKPAEGK